MTRRAASLDLNSGACRAPSHQPHSNLSAAAAKTSSMSAAGRLSMWRPLRAGNALNGFENVREAVRDAKGLGHTGTTSERTRLRKDSGKAIGVSTSTDTPSRRCSSTWMAA